MKNRTSSIPIAEKKTDSKILHGVVYEDDYSWLRDSQWQDVLKDPSLLDPKIRKYLKLENDYSDIVLAPLNSLKEEILEEMKGRMKRDDASVPIDHGEFAYFYKYDTNDQHPIFCRTENNGCEQILIDGNEEAAGKSFFKFGNVKNSPDHRLFAYSYDDTGSEKFSIRFKGIGSGEIFDEVIEGTDGSFQWLNNSSAIVYTLLDDNHRPYLVKRHVLDTRIESDVDLYEELDPGFFVSTYKTEDQKYLVIKSHDHQTSEVRVVKDGNLVLETILIEKRVTDCEYHLSHHDGQFFILTNADGAADFKIVTVSDLLPTKKNWTNMCG